MCLARFISVLTSLPPLPFHSLSTPSPLPLSWMCEYLHQVAPMGIAVRPWRVVCVTANMQCAVPLSLLFSFLAPPAMLLCTQRGAGAQPRQQDMRASSSCSLESKSSAFSSSPHLLILCSLLLCAVSHSMHASMPCHIMHVCVQGAGVGQEREPSNLQLAFPAPQTRFLTHSSDISGLGKTHSENSQPLMSLRKWQLLGVAGSYSIGLRLTGSATFIEPLAYLMIMGNVTEMLM